MLLPFYALDRHPQMKGPIDVLTDARHVRGLDVSERLPEFSRTLRRHAIVHPPIDRVVGIAVAGLCRALVPRFATDHFMTPAEGLRWLGYGADTPFAHMLERLTDEARSETLSQLRGLLARRPETARLSEVAVSLGVAERSLQRALQEAGSTFREEIDEARGARFAELLVTTPDKLETIARRLGIARAPLTRVFLRLRGSRRVTSGREGRRTPDVWRTFEHFQARFAPRKPVPSGHRGYGAKRAATRGRRARTRHVAAARVFVF